MGERIIATAESALKKIEGPVVLGRAADGTAWARIADRHLAPALAKKAAPSLLYFSVADYEHAVRKLPPDEVEAAVLLRLSYFPAMAAGQTTDFVHRRARELLVLAASAAETGTGQAVPALEGYFRSLLDILSRLAGQGRYDDLDAKSLLEYAAEGEATILAEAKALGQRFGAATSRIFEGMDEPAAFYEAYARMLAALGSPELSEAPLYVDGARGVLHLGAGRDLAERLRRTCTPAIVVPAGVIAPLTDRALEEPSPERIVLYFSTGDFVSALAGLTTAQMERDVRERRLAMETEPVPLVRDHFFDLRLGQALLRRNLAAVVQRDVPAFAQEVEVHVKREEHTLRRALAAVLPWLGDPGPAPRERLGEEGRRLADDAAFFADLAGAAGDEMLRAKLSGLALSQGALQKTVPGP